MQVVTVAVVYRMRLELVMSYIINYSQMQCVVKLRCVL